MKKFLISMMAALMLLSCLSFTAFADTVAPDKADVQFSVKDASGKPGDEVEVQVYLDQNPGIWCAKFEVHFDATYFQLISVENGEVFNNAEFVKSVTTDKGRYTYYAEGNSYDQNVTNTGLILTLKLQVLNNAINGQHEVSLVFPDDGYGWFFTAVPTNDPKNPIDFVDLTVGQTNSAYISVDGSTATADPNATTAADTTSSGGAAVTDAYNYVTDEAGAPVTDAYGGYVTEKVEPGTPVIGYETDADGSFVTDENGNYETYVIDENTTADPDAAGNSDTTGENGEASATDDTPKNTTVKKIVIIGCIAAIVVAAIILIVVLTSKKNGGDDGTGGATAPTAPETPAVPDGEQTEEVPKAEDATSTDDENKAE